MAIFRSIFGGHLVTIGESCSSIELSRTWMGDRLKKWWYHKIFFKIFFFLFFPVFFFRGLFHAKIFILNLLVIAIYHFLSQNCVSKVSKNTKNRFSQKGLSENFYFWCFLIVPIRFSIGLIVIPQVHFKSIQTQFRLPVVHLNSKWQAQAWLKKWQDKLQVFIKLKNIALLWLLLPFWWIIITFYQNC